MRWFLNPNNAQFEEIARKHNISILLAKLLCNRGMVDDDAIDKFLNGTKEDMYDPRLLKGLEDGVKLLYKMAKQGKKIRIIGDYDIDGICSSFILKKGISQVVSDLSLIDIRIPHRVLDGYGLNDRLIDEAAESGVDLIITCDNGIAAAKQIAHAKEAGITVIVTDHHEVPYDENDGIRTYILPPADVIVDPKQEDDTYPFSEICGGMVAYKFVEVLLEYVLADYENTDEFEQKKAEILKIQKECFAFAAFATVGDVMELLDENHIAVKYGLQEIKNTGNYGLNALIELCDLADKEITPYHIGFVLGPCFNASGRLDDAYRVIEMLEAQNETEAMGLAEEIRALNQERKELTAQGEEVAVQMVEQEGLASQKVLVVYLPGVHESLAGIIASHLCKKYYRPTFVLTNGEEGVKGSGRSIECYHMYDEMTKIKDIFAKYGGHKLAAGLTLNSVDDVEIFRNRINEVCEVPIEEFEEKIILDWQLPFDQISFALLEELKKLEPFGNGNRRPIFAERVRVSGVRVFGANRNVVKCQLKTEQGSMDGICFCDGDEFLENYNHSNHSAKIAFCPKENTYNGRTSIQIEISNLEWYHDTLQNE